MNEMNETEAVVLPEEATALIANSTKYASGVLEIYGGLKSCVIKTEKQYENVDAEIKILKKGIKKVEKCQKEITAPIEREKKAVIAHFKTNCIEHLLGAVDVLNDARIIFYQDKVKKEREEQAKRDAEAEKIRKQKEEKARKEAEKVEKYTAEGRDDMAEKAQIRQEAAVEEAACIVAPIAPSTAKCKGTSFMTKYAAVVTNKQDAVKALIGNPILMRLVDINIKQLEAEQNRAKGELKIAGINFQPYTATRDRG